jgi:L-cystine transport system permease protein
MSFSFQGLLECLASGIKYLPNTLLMTFMAVALGLIFGFLIAMARYLKIPVLSQFLAAFVVIYNGIPVILAMMIYNLIFLIKFDSFAASLGLNLTTADVPTVWVGAFTLGMSCMCYMSESIRGALLSVNRGQFEAGYSVGMNTPQIMRRIVVPQIVPVVMPMLLNSLIGTLKGTSVVIVIGIMDVLNGALIPCHVTYSFLVGYVAAALIYWVLTLIIEGCTRILRSRTDRFIKVPI